MTEYTPITAQDLVSRQRSLDEARRDLGPEASPAEIRRREEAISDDNIRDVQLTFLLDIFRNKCSIGFLDESGKWERCPNPLLNSGAITLNGEEAAEFDRLGLGEKVEDPKVSAQRLANDRYFAAPLWTTLVFPGNDRQVEVRLDTRRRIFALREKA